MAPKKVHSQAWALAARQHGVLARQQLLGLGLGSDAIKHRIAKGRLHPIRRGVYAVGRREISSAGAFMAAVMACGLGAALSDESAAQHWGIRPHTAGPI